MDDTWPNRFHVARKVLDLRESPNDVTDVEFGARVGRRLGRDPYVSGSVSQWKSETQIPPAAVQLAIALECGVDPGWLAFGSESSAAPPALWGMVDIATAAEALPQPDRQRRPASKLDRSNRAYEKDRTRKERAEKAVKTGKRRA